jgi:hypothetical protein
MKTMAVTQKELSDFCRNMCTNRLGWSDRKRRDCRESASACNTLITYKKKLIKEYKESK